MENIATKTFASQFFDTMKIDTAFKRLILAIKNSTFTLIKIVLTSSILFLAILKNSQRKMKTIRIFCFMLSITKIQQPCCCY